MTPDLPSTAHDDTKMTMTTETSERSDTSTTLRDNAEVAEALGRRYEAGFVTDIETDSLPPGLSEDIIRQLSALKQEPEWMTEWRLKAYRHWLTMPTPDWAKLNLEPDRLSGDQLLRRAQAGPEVAGRSRSEAAGNLRKARRALARARQARRRRRRRGVRLGLRGHHLPQGAGRGRRDLLLDERSDPRARRAGAAVPGQRGADRRQLFRRAELGGVLRWLLRVHPQGRALPDGAEHLLPHQRAATPASSSAP